MTYIFILLILIIAIGLLYKKNEYFDNYEKTLNKCDTQWQQYYNTCIVNPYCYWKGKKCIQRYPVLNWKKLDKYNETSIRNKNTLKKLQKNKIINID